MADPLEKNPMTVMDGPEKVAIVRKIEDWRERFQFVIRDRLSREKILFDHWRVISYDREASATYPP
jgi:hypothetical protein